MRQKRWRNLLLLFIALGAVILIWSMVGITINIPLQRPIEKLEQARTLWQQQNISSYTMNVRFARSLAFVGWVKVIVENNKVVRVENTNGEDGSTFEPNWYTTNFGYANYFPPSLDHYTVDQLFDFAAEKLRDEPAPPVIVFYEEIRLHYSVEFDPQRGNITSLSYSNCPEKPDFGGGLLGPVVSDCANGFTISDLSP
jgi:hypothetical protein